MGQTVPNITKKIGKLFGLYGSWIIAAVLWVLAGIQLQRVFVLLGNLIIQSQFKPTGWSSDTLSGINRCGFFIFGALALGIIIFSESYLREGATEGQLLRRAGRLVLIAAGLFVLSLGLVFLLS
jgi:hypothetical protein